MSRSMHEIPSIHEILTSAFEDIKLYHQVAVTKVDFDVMPAGGMASVDYHLCALSVDCKPCSRPPD